MNQTFIKVFCTFLLGTIPHMADYLNEFVYASLPRALLDNMTHVAIGVVSWIVVEPSSIKVQRPSRSLIAVAVLSSLIDIDHFIAARSIHLKNALRAPYRGIFHCSGAMLVVNVIMFCLNFHWGVVFLVSWVPHHLRDAVRRGIFLLPPQMSTDPLPNIVVTLLTMTLPWVVSLVQGKMSPLNQPIRNVFDV
ncbi:unnamed protein product [Allacma fusca]|uniref:Transmembrane protein 267 n=1 Tax=Allacma fusca TaxID=39272 RepID=A0A8J2KK30_9HEXA|nr:unnamed protein product [Allacma fusca]